MIFSFVISVVFIAVKDSVGFDQFIEGEEEEDEEEEEEEEEKEEARRRLGPSLDALGASLGALGA
eukprot:3217002-Pyramimonas_sp.AAC.1